jgi:hypothetical protein
LDWRSEVISGSPSDQPIVHDYRSHHFESDSSQHSGIILQKRVLVFDDYRIRSQISGLPENIVRLAGISDIILIQSNSTVQAMRHHRLVKNRITDIAIIFKK